MWVVKNAAGGRHFHSHFKRELVFLHQQADALQAGKGGMPLVHVEDLRLEPKHIQGLYAADAEQNFPATGAFPGFRRIAWP